MKPNIVIDKIIGVIVDRNPLITVNDPNKEKARLGIFVDKFNIQLYFIVKKEKKKLARGWRDDAYIQIVIPHKFVLTGADIVDVQGYKSRALVLRGRGFIQEFDGDKTLIDEHNGQEVIIIRGESFAKIGAKNIDKLRNYIETFKIDIHNL